MPMRVFLDDERATPPGWVRTYWPDEVITLLKTGDVAVVARRASGTPWNEATHTARAFSQLLCKAKNGSGNCNDLSSCPAKLVQKSDDYSVPANECGRTDETNRISIEGATYYDASVCYPLYILMVERSMSWHATAYPSPAS